MDDEELLCRFGTPLEPLEEDEIPSKKPLQIEDQIVTDENGRRRFHGAFTGGFSAGFWNTVGSLEGWQPKEFKSSRAEKAELRKQKPSDFMDDEDIGEFGIAPQRVQTTEDFTPQDNKIGQKRKIQKNTTDCPIPGMPVLEQLLRPAKDMVAIRLLKKMGWKQGQGIGARQTRKEKKTTAKRNAREQYIMKMYGCDVGPSNNKSINLGSDESDLSDTDEITFAPDDFEPYVCVIKDNTFGLGYTGLCREPILKSQHVNLFGPLEIIDKDNKKLSIRGQAFGVGALEEEDEDIYQHEDITKYDFALGNNSKNMKNSQLKQIKNQESFVIDGFHINENKKNIKKIFKISLPDNYQPRNWFKRRTRFEPLDDNRAERLKKLNEHKIKGLGRHDLNPNDRGQILGETVLPSNKSTENIETIDEKDVKNNVKTKKSYLETINEKYKIKEVNTTKRQNVLDMLSSKFDKFTKSEIIKEDGTIQKQSDLPKGDVSLDDNVRKENEKLQNEANKITSKLDKTAGVFKPFLSDDLKQERYDKFLAANLETDNEIKKFLLTIQPLHMSEWDREIEKKEFLQAQKIYKPLKGMMKERFVPESAILAEREIKQVAKDCNEKLVTLRTKKMWKPCSELCKRFNIAEPFGGTMVDEKIVKKTKYSVFDYLETSINNKTNFITPVIIPRKAEIPKPIIKQQEQKRISTKDLFTNELKMKPKSKDSLPNKDEKYIKEDNNSKSIIEKSKIEKPKTELEKRIEETRDQHPSEKKDLFKSIFDSSSEDEDDPNSKQKLDINKDTPQKIEIPTEILSILTKPTSELNKLRNNLPSSKGVSNISSIGFLKSDENLNTSIQSKNDSIKIINEEIIQTPRKIIFKSKKQRLADEMAQSKVETVVTEDTIESTETAQSKTGEQSKDNGQFKDSLDLEPKDYTVDLPPQCKDIIEDENIYGPKIPIGSLKTIQPAGLQEIDKTPDIDEKLLKIFKKHKKIKIVEEWVEKTDEKSTSLSLSGDKSRKKKKKDKEKDKNKKSKKHKKDKKHKK